MPQAAVQLAGLNAAQKDAVVTDSGPLLVLAGAGTGKTRVVTVRIARLIGRGQSAERILAVTFTNKAAEEMQTRVGEQLRRTASKRPHISTFHSYCVSVLRRHITRFDYPPRFAIYSTGPQRSVAQRVLREAKMPSTTLRPDDLLRHISRWKSRGWSPEQAAAQAVDDREHLAAIGYRRYQAMLRSLAAVDFDDLLLLTQQLFQRFPSVRRAEAERFDHVLIDEYQDTNASQYRIVCHLAAGHRNLCVVGDDDQSIYGWRGAQVTHILNFQKDWPDAKVVRLEENYRSKSPILACANRLILANRQRYAKVLRPTCGDGSPVRVHVYDDGEAEALMVVDEIASLLESKKFSPADLAILFRTNEQPRLFEQHLRRQKVPYVLIGHSSFFDRREIKDVLAYLRLLSDPDDDLALLRVINRPARGISAATVQRLRQRSSQQSCSIWRTLQDESMPAGLTEQAVLAARQWTRQMREFAEQLATHPASDVARRMLDVLDYRREIETGSSDPGERLRRWQSVTQLLDDLSNAERIQRSLVLSDYLNDLVLRDRDFEVQTSDKNIPNKVHLMTLHAAKGLEFPVVYLVGLEEGLLPHRKSISDRNGVEEERRLCYVGVTRARQQLTVTLARQRENRGRMRDAHPSRFLYELLGKTDHPDYQTALQFNERDGNVRSRMDAGSSRSSTHRRASRRTP